ncbi:MAG: hypothetical protein IRY83_17405 [Chloroflexi bacterium]|nr:hypothetical protein [Chloroflexota bacterium]
MEPVPIEDRREERPARLREGRTTRFVPELARVTPWQRREVAPPALFEDASREGGPPGFASAMH